MNRQQHLDRVFRTVIVGVIRAQTGEQLVDVAQALLAGGVEVMEVTFTVPGAAQVIERVAGRLGDRILLGAGTPYFLDELPGSRMVTFWRTAKVA